MIVSASITCDIIVCSTNCCMCLIYANIASFTIHQFTFCSHNIFINCAQVFVNDIYYIKSKYATQKEALGLCDNLVKNVKQVESLTDLEVVTPDVEDSERHHLHLVTRDVVHQYFMFGFEV